MKDHWLDYVMGITYPNMISERNVPYIITFPAPLFLRAGGNLVLPRPTTGLETRAQRN